MQSFVHRFLLVAARSVFGGPQLVHLGHALLELLVLALFVRVALVLALSVPIVTRLLGCLPRTSTAGKTPRIGSGSAGSAGVRRSRGRRAAGGRRSSPRGWPLWGISVGAAETDEPIRAREWRHALWSLRPTAFFSVSVTVMVAVGAAMLVDGVN